MNIDLDENERIEDLQCNDLKIIQNKNLYTFTSDSVVLANFIDLKKKDRVAEIGTGCGVISILLTAKTNFEKIEAFELQKDMASLAEKNIKLNNLENKIEVHNIDVKQFASIFKEESFDAVFSNPPYMKTGKSCNANLVRDIARHDSLLSIEDLCFTASKMLKFGGKFYLVYSSERSSELVYTLIKYKLEPKRMFFTENGKGKVVLVVIEAVKGGKHGVKVLPNLVTNEETGEYLKVLQTKYIKLK